MSAEAVAIVGTGVGLLAVWVPHMRCLYVSLAAELAIPCSELRGDVVEVRGACTPWRSGCPASRAP